MRRGQEVAYRPIRRNGIRLRGQGPETVAAFVVREEVAARGGTSVGVLDVVVTVVVGLPYVDPCARDRPTTHIHHPALDPARLARRVAADVSAQLDERRVRDEERADDGGLGRASGGVVVHDDHLHRRPEDVGQQDELLPLVVGHMADAGEEVDPLLPLTLRQPDFADEGVQMLDQRGQYRLQPLVGRACEAGDDGVDKLLLLAGLGVRLGVGSGHDLPSVPVGRGSLPTHAPRSTVSSDAASTRRGLFGGTSGKISATAGSMSSSRSPRSRSAVGASMLVRSWCSPSDASSAPSAAAMLAPAVAANGALKASTCGSTIACVGACGRPNAPPRTWQILWCRPDPADANATAAR